MESSCAVLESLAVRDVETQITVKENRGGRTRRKKGSRKKKKKS